MTRTERIKNLEQLFGFKIPVDDMLFKAFGKISINVMVLNTELAKHDPEYHPASFAYRGEANVSMMDYLVKKYGQEIADEVSDLL